MIFQSIVQYAAVLTSTRNINMHKINDTRKIKMKQCIFCMEWKEDKEFNREHIILEALGGKGDKDICLNVCTSCNSSLGTRVDASLLNQSITKYMRYKFKIRGKNGIPNPFKGIEVKYADTKRKVAVSARIKAGKERRIWITILSIRRITAGNPKFAAPKGESTRAKKVPSTVPVTDI